MQNPHCIIICFDYGGYYMKDGAKIKWISGDGEGEDEIHTIVLKKSVEEVTYNGLVERICRKIKVDESKMKVKISYFPMVLYSYKPSYIWDDEDVLGYLLQVNDKKCRSVLHVEFINEEVHFSEEDDENDVYAGLSDREATDREATDREATDIEAGDEDGIGGMLTFHEDIEMDDGLNQPQDDGLNQPRDDGMDLVLGQKFRTKEAARFHFQTASYENFFEFDTIKSDTNRYVVKCRGANEGCKWFVRVAKVKNSDVWTVRSFFQQHTCDVVTTRPVPYREAEDEDGTENDETDNEGIGGVLTFHEDIEMHENVTGRDEHVFEDTEARPPVVNQPRDDGIDLVLGQEFRTKEAAKVHIQTASHQKCFEFEIIKSDTKRFVIKCRLAKEGCGWFVRVVKLKNSDLWTVTSYIKQHTCSVVTTRTLRDRRKGTQQIVSAVLAQDYPGTFNTPVPKVLIDLVHRKVGVSVSYTTAWRGKREAANEVRGSPEESFTLLYCYMHMLEQTNIGTRTCVVVDAAQKFKYLLFFTGS